MRDGVRGRAVRRRDHPPRGGESAASQTDDTTWFTGQRADTDRETQRATERQSTYRTYYQSNQEGRRQFRGNAREPNVMCKSEATASRRTALIEAAPRISPSSSDSWPTSIGGERPGGRR